MSSHLYSGSQSGAQEAVSLRPDIVTVAQTVHPNLYLTKIFYRDKVQTYDNVRTFNFYEYRVEHLDDLARIVLKMIEQPRCCLLRAVPKDKTRKVFRRINGDDATLIEQPQHWFAIDVDGYSEATGDIRSDAEKVLIGLGWQNVDCFAVASASYGVKPGIRLRMFFWANRPVECIVLKKLLMNNKVCADLAMFYPIQPIYVARPLFRDGMTDPVKKRFVLLAGSLGQVMIPWNLQPADRYAERLYSRRQARTHLKKAYNFVLDAQPGSRHDVLINMGIWMGKLIAQDVLDHNEAVETLFDATLTWGDGNPKRDMQNILDGIKNGMKKMEGEL